MNLREQMGTNYYAKIDRNDGYDLVHLGKACYKLRFAFRWNPECYKDFKGFKEFVESRLVINQFGRSVDPDFIIESVRDKQGESSIAKEYQKAGKRDLVHIVKESDKGKLVAEHHFIDEEFGIEVVRLTYGPSNRKK